MNKTIDFTAIGRIALIILGTAASSDAISIRTPGTILGDPDTITQDRFEAGTPGAIVNPDFEFDAYDFSGVGWSSANTVRSVALIDDQHFLAAQHAAISGTINFLTNVGVESFAVASYTNIGSSDLKLGTLSAPIDLVAKGIISYAILDPSENPVGHDFLLYGKRGRIGEGTFDATDSITVSGVTGDVIQSTYNIASGANNDAFFTSGDSGGPSFIVGNDGSLILTGIHWAVGDDGDDGPPVVPATEKYNYDTDVGNYVSDLNAISGLTVTTVLSTVPEPSSTLLLGVGLIGFTLRRKR